MPSIADECALDAVQASVSDELILAEGHGEDEETTELHVLSVPAEGGAAIEYLVRYPDQGKLAPLYRRLSAAEQAQLAQQGLPAWEGESRELRVTKSKETFEKGATIHLAAGPGPAGERLLKLGDTLWLLEDHVVPLGDTHDRLARVSTPAAALPRRTVKPVEEKTALAATLSYLAFGLVLAYGAADLFGLLGGFPWAFGVVGVIAAIACHSPGARASTLLAGAFALYLLTRTFSPAILGALPGVAGLVGRGPGAVENTYILWALCVMVLLVPLYLFSRKLLYVVSDAAVWTALGTLVVYTVGMGVWSCLDEDFGWFDHWGHYFRSSPWCYIWLAVLLYAGYLVYRDYRKVPMSLRGFNVLRERVLRLLRGEHPWKRAQAIGDGLDDLADALRLSDDFAVHQLYGHQDDLLQLSKAFLALAKRGGAIPSIAERAKQLREDLRLFADDLAQIENGGQAPRLSPLWLSLGAEEPEELIPEP